MLNLAVVAGPVSTAPEIRALPSGSAVASVGVRTRSGERTTSVPVCVWDPPAWLAELSPGDELIVLGTVRRRFYRSGGATGSRVEVDATFVGRPGRRQRDAVARRVEAAMADLVE